MKKNRVVNNNRRRFVLWKKQHQWEFQILRRHSIIEKLQALAPFKGIIKEESILEGTRRINQQHQTWNLSQDSWCPFDPENKQEAQIKKQQQAVISLEVS